MGDLDTLDVTEARSTCGIETYRAHRLLTFDREPSTREPTVEIAHEALLRAWARLASWIDDAREDLRQEQLLARASASGAVPAGIPAPVARSPPRAGGDVVRNHRVLGVGRPQLEYIKASTDRRDVNRGLEDERHEHEIHIERRSRVRLRALVAVFAVAAIVAATLTIVATDQAKRASDAARIARARGLAGAAISDLQADPERSVLLAVAAVNETRTVDGSVLPEAEEALHRAIATSRVVMTVPGAGGEVAWGSAGTFAATSSDDPGTIVVADEETGETVRRLDAHVGLVTGLAFHPDGSLLASTGDDGTLRLWDNSTGEALKTVRGTGVASQVSFTADGSVAAAMWPDHGLIRFVDTETQRVVDTLGAPGAS